MTLTEAAWLAGFFDGEGSLSCHRGGNGGKYICWTLTLVNTSHAAIQVCRRYTGGVGIVTDKSKYRRLSHHKKIWEWRVNVQNDIEAIVLQMLPYLIIKRQKAEEFLMWLMEH